MSNMGVRRYASSKAVLLSSAFAVALTFIAAAEQRALAAVPPAPRNPVTAEISDLLAKAQGAMRQGRPEVAVIYLKNAATAAPEVGVVHHALGEALLAVGNYSQAQRELNVAIQSGVPTPKVLPLIYQAMLAQRQGQLLLNQYPAPDPSDRSALASATLRARAIAQMQSGKKDDAIRSLDDALKIDRTGQNLSARAQLALNLGDSKLADDLLDETLAKERNNPAALMMKISLLQKSSRPEAALPYSDKLVKVSNNSPTSLITRAGIYLQLGKDSKAVADVSAALAVAPSYSTAIFYNAIIKSRGKDPKGAWAVAQTLPKEYPPSRPDVGAAVGQIAVEAGQLEAGRDILHNTMQAHPRDEEVKIRLAATYLALNEIAKASETLIPLHQSTNPRALALIGQVYAKQNNAQESLKYFKRASARGFGGDALKSQLAVRDIQFGDLDSAERAFRELNTKKANRPEILASLINIQLRKKDFRAAAKLADDFANSAPKDPYGPLFQGRVAREQGNDERAIAYFTAALKRDPKFAAALFDRGSTAASRGDYKAAQTDLVAATAANPRSSQAAVRLAQLFEQTGETQRALSVLKNAVQNNPQDFAATAALQEYYTKYKRFDEAADNIATFIRSSPNNNAAIALQGNVEFARGNIDGAIKTFSALSKANPRAPDISIALARAYMKKGDYPRARDVLQKAIASSNAPGLHLALIQQDVLSKNLKDAVTHARTFATKVPSAQSASVLATVLASTGEQREAEQVLSKSQDTRPNSSTIMQLSTLKRNMGKANEADDLLRTWVAKTPNDAMARAAYATSLMKSNPARAEEQFMIVLKRDPYHLPSLNNVAWLLQRRDRNAALNFANRAQKMAPNMPSVLDTVGWIKWQMNDRQEAMRLLQRARSGAPNDPTIGFHLASALASSNQLAEAKRVLLPISKTKVAFEEREQAIRLLQEINSKLDGARPK